MIEIGFFKERYDGEYPPFAAKDLPESIRKTVLQYMKTGKVIGAVPGIMRDVFADKRVPGEFLLYSDGEYIWNSESIFYFERYKLLLPDSFIQKAMMKIK